MDPTVLVALAGTGSTIGAILLTSWFNRRHLAAQTQNITTTAHTQIYAQYAELLTTMRNDMQLTREEARAAHDVARQAEKRADDAEEKAYSADYRLRSMERLLVDLRPLIVLHVPGHEAWVGQMDRLMAARPS